LLWPNDYFIWVYNDKNQKVMNAYKDLVWLKFGPEFRNRPLPPLGFYDPYKPGVAYAAPYAHVIKHEWAHLIHGHFHGNETSYAW
jgi:hypothetical protein